MLYYPLAGRTSMAEKVKINIHLQRKFRTTITISIAFLFIASILMFTISQIADDFNITSYAYISAAIGIFILLRWGIKSLTPAIVLKQKKIVFRTFLGKTIKIRIDKIHHVYEKNSEIIIQREKKDTIRTEYFDYSKTELKNPDSLIAAIQAVRHGQKVSSVTFNNTQTPDTKQTKFFESQSYFFRMLLAACTLAIFGILLMLASKSDARNHFYVLGKTLLNPTVWLLPLLSLKYSNLAFVELNNTGVYCSQFRREVPYQYIKEWTISNDKLVLKSRCTTEGINIDKLNKDFKIKLNRLSFEDAKALEEELQKLVPPKSVS